MKKKAALLQPICNMSLQPEHQPVIAKSGAVKGVVQALSTSRSQQGRQIALQCITNVTTSHDDVRDTVVAAGAVPPLAVILKGDGTTAMMEQALNCMINISNTGNGEDAIIKQNAIPSIIGLLYSKYPTLVLQATSLLSNMCTKQEVREFIRSYDWVEPLLFAIKNGDDNFFQQALRVVINSCFDPFCRYLLVHHNVHTQIGQRVKSATSSPSSSSPSSSSPSSSSSSSPSSISEKSRELAVKALQNLKVPSGSQVEQEMTENIKRGLKKIEAPSAKQAPEQKDDFEGLDDVIKGINKV